MHGLVIEDWADGSYQFRLAYGQWLELDQLLQVGPMALYVRLLDRQWKANDIREIIRLGLIGGGCNPIKALQLTKTYVEERPLLESLPLAMEIVSASLTPPKGDRKPGKAKAAQKTETSASTSGPPSETLEQSVSH